MGRTRIPRPRRGDLNLRPARAGDGSALATLMHAAVHRGTGDHYTDAQRAAWSPAPPAGPEWDHRLLSGYTVVAEEARQGPVGFATLGDDGHLDLFYVAPDRRGGATAPALHDAVLARGRALGLAVLSTEASHLARRFLERRGWRCLARQSVIRHGVALTNFRMERDLGG